MDYARWLTGLDRSKRANLHLGAGLAFVAGATNAGAFLAMGLQNAVITKISSAEVRTRTRRP